MLGTEKNNRTWRDARWDSKVSHIPQRRFPVNLLEEKKKGKEPLNLHHIKNKRKNQMLRVRIERKLLHNQQNEHDVLWLRVSSHMFGCFVGCTCPSHTRPHTHIRMRVRTHAA